MNKQEAIEQIKNLNARETFMSEIIWVKRDDVLDIIKQLDESVRPPKPKKPVVPPCIDRWIQGCKYNGFDLLEAITMSIDMPEETGKWINDNPETFAKAWLYDYDVEKEKLYRAKNRHTGEYLCYCFGFFHDKNSSSENQRFTAEEKRWEELGYWGNGLYDFEEAEGEDEQATT